MTQPKPPNRPDRIAWPFRQWGVGDSEFFTQHTRRAITAAHVAGHDKGWRFATEARTENSQAGVRVWRIA